MKSNRFCHLLLFFQEGNCAYFKHLEYGKFYFRWRHTGPSARATELHSAQLVWEWKQLSDYYVLKALNSA